MAAVRPRSSVNPGRPGCGHGRQRRRCCWLAGASVTCGVGRHVRLRARLQQVKGALAATNPLSSSAPGRRPHREVSGSVGLANALFLHAQPVPHSQETRSAMRPHSLFSHLFPLCVFCFSSFKLSPDPRFQRLQSIFLSSLFSLMCCQEL